MNYEFIKIERVGPVEVAYLLEKTSGRLLKVLVQDQTGGYSPKQVAPEYRESTATAVHPDSESPSRQPSTAAGLVPKGFVPALPDKPPPAVPPPGLAGVFGGTAEEKRIV